MAVSEPIIVKNRNLFKGNIILYHQETQTLVSIPDSMYLQILRQENIKFLAELPDYEIDCYYLTSDTEAITSHSKKFKVSELLGIGFSPNSDETQFAYFAGKHF